MRQSGKSDCWI